MDICLQTAEARSYVALCKSFLPSFRRQGAITPDVVMAILVMLKHNSLPNKARTCDMALRPWVGCDMQAWIANAMERVRQKAGHLRPTPGLTIPAPLTPTRRDQRPCHPDMSHNDCVQPMHCANAILALATGFIVHHQRAASAPACCRCFSHRQCPLLPAMITHHLACSHQRYSSYRRTWLPLDKSYRAPKQEY